MKRMLVDLSSILWTSLLFGKDEEFGREVEFEGKKVFINSAQHGYDNAVDYLLSVMKKFDITPISMIFAEDGVNAKSLRRTLLPGYKDKDKRAPESYEEFNKLKQRLLDDFCNLGASAAWQEQREGDDILAYLALSLEGERIVVTNDGDMARLIGNGVHLFRKDELDLNPYGPFDVKYITLYKALVGDTSDCIPGAKGFGPKAFLDTLCIFGEDGLASFEDMVLRKKLGELQENVAELKVLQKVIDNADTVYASYACAKLYPDMVNTLRAPLQWRVGMVKRRTKDMDERLKPFAGQVKLIHKDNYAEASKFFAERIDESTFFTLDIETSTPEESDMWLENAKGKSSEDDDIGVDQFGSELTGLSLTFGRNNEFTFYFTVDHRETASIKNLKSGQVLHLVKMIPKSRANVVHNAAFELTVLYQEWKSLWDDPEWHGFLPNVHDTMLMASYVDENEPRGLKKVSARLMQYTQDTYKTVTTVVFDPEGIYPITPDEEVTIVREGDMPWPGGVMLDEGDGWEKWRYKMNELTAEHVLGYGADDTICTAAAYNHFRAIMEIERTWSVFLEVEVLPAYVTALAFVQGTPISLERLKELEREDDKIHLESWAIVRDFLIAKGWEGTVCPVYTEFTPANIKEALLILTGAELKTQVRTVSKFPPLIRDMAEGHEREDRLMMIASMVEHGDLKALNKFVKDNFTGEPSINFDSPKQVQTFLYETLGIPVRIVNKLTPNEREKQPELAEAVRKHNKKLQGSTQIELTPEELELLKKKAATDDTAVEFALAFDASEEQKKILNALTAVKKVETRRKLYYRPYPNLLHWKDGKLHSNARQSSAATRRYTMSGPNLQQLAKKGEGVKVRSVIIPHVKGGVIPSIDFVGQELRLMAGQSLDANMLACYIGSKLKDIHSITAAGAMAKKWTQAVVDEFAVRFGAHLNKDDKDYLYDLFVTLHKHVEDKEVKKKADDLRKDAKNVNFAAQFDAQALKLSQMLIMIVEDAQGFLDAKYAMFPGVETWKDEVRAQLKRDGFVTTMMGGRRHLRDSILNPNKWEAERAGRQGPNFKIQGSAAEQTKLALARLWKSGILFTLNMRFIAPVHDEIVWSVSREDAVESIRVVHQCMTAQYADLCVPVLGSISVGPHFGKQHECGDDFIEPNIVAALDKIMKEREPQLA